MKTGIYGDMFVSDDLIFRIYNNSHPKDHYIGYPIYEIAPGNLIKKIKSDKYLKKYLKKIGDGIMLPLVPKKNITRYFSCLDLDLDLDDEIKEDFEIIVKKLKGIGIKNIGLTGSTHLRGRGFEKDFKKSDLDFVIYGAGDCELLDKKLNELYDEDFESYTSYPEKIYQRRKHHSTPFKIDFFTAKEFEARKPQGILNNRHINITPTKIIDEPDLFNKKDIKLIGLKKIKIKILENDESNCVPAKYLVEDVFSGKKYFLYTNIFYYSLGKRGAMFNVECEEAKINDESYLFLDSWGHFEEYCMNILPKGIKIKNN